MTERRNPLRLGAVNADETHERRLQALESRMYNLERWMESMRAEVTRCETTAANITTDLHVVKRRLADGEPPDRFIIRDVEED